MGGIQNLTPPILKMLYPTINSSQCHDKFSINRAHFFKYIFKRQFQFLTMFNVRSNIKHLLAGDFTCLHRASLWRVSPVKLRSRTNDSHVSDKQKWILKKRHTPTCGANLKCIVPAFVYERLVVTEITERPSYGQI